MNYNGTLQFLYSQLPMYQRQGVSAFKKDLKNIKVLLARDGNPHESFRSIHIAGTNGKGSVTHMIAAGLQSQGYKVGVYTSPHYVDFRERIKINGELISRKKVIAYVEFMREKIKNVEPSFFEFSVGMAFHYFREEKVDFAVIETGLGGRLDSTNIITPLISVITNISQDHTHMLGDTLPEIAGEKAGIIKAEVPCLIGEFQEDVAGVFIEKAKSTRSPLYWAKDKIEQNGKQFFSGSELLVDCNFSNMEGPFFQINLRTAIAALKILDDQGLDFCWMKYNAYLPDFARKTYYLGRWQWISRNPDILVDSAHNKGGLLPTLEMINTMSYSRIHFVLGFSSDKEVKDILSLFPSNHDYYFVKADVPRGMPVDTILKSAETAGLKGKGYSSVRRGLAAARRRQQEGELIYVGGSIFVIAEVL